MRDILPEGTTWLDLVTLGIAFVALALTVRRERALGKVGVGMEAIMEGQDLIVGLTNTELRPVSIRAAGVAADKTPTGFVTWNRINQRLSSGGSSVLSDPPLPAMLEVGVPAYEVKAPMSRVEGTLHPDIEDEDYLAGRSLACGFGGRRQAEPRSPIRSRGDSDRVLSERMDIAIAQVLAGAFLAASLTGLASAGLLALEWRREADIRRGERRLETAERLLASVGLLRSQVTRSTGQSIPLDADVTATKGLVQIQTAVLRKYGIPEPVEAAVAAIIEVLPEISSVPVPAARLKLQDGAEILAQVVIEQLARP